MVGYIKAKKKQKSIKPLLINQINQINLPNHILDQIFEVATVIVWIFSKKIKTFVKKRLI